MTKFRFATFLLLLLCSAQFTFAQSNRVTLNFKDATYRSIFDEIEKQTEHIFLINEGEIDTSKRTSINSRNESLDNVLKKLLSPLKLNYVLQDKYIVLKKADNTASEEKQKKALKGTVIDENNEPLIGVSVAVKNTDFGVATNLDGEFNINVSPSDVLVFSYIGFTPQEVEVKNQNTINIVLEEDTKMLGEVIVIGYGSITKKEMTSAISHVSSKDFLNISSPDPSMLIQGKVAGVSVTNTGVGDPNNTASIQVRGVTSMSAGLGPLIVIDGIPGGNLTNINSNDIESIDVLKDGAASAIYGTRGSNGVVLVTTKKGTKDGKIRTSYNGIVAVNMIKKEMDPLSADEFRKYRVPNNQGVDQGGDTNWLDEITRTGFTHQHTFTLSGSTIKSNYRASIDYRNSTGIDLRSSREEYGGRFSLNHQAANGLLDFSINIAPRIAYRNNSDRMAFTTALEANPTTPVRDPNNPLLYSNFKGQAADFNPVELLKLDQSGGDTKLLDWNVTAKLNLLPLLAKDGNSIHSLNTQVTLAQQQNDNFNFWFRPSTSTQAINNGRSGEASRDYGKSKQESLEWIGNYIMEQKGHRVRGMLGYSYQYFQYQGMSASNKDFPSDILSYNNLSQGEWAKEEGEMGMGSYKNDAKLIAFFGRVSYDYLERYLLTASLRYEGSSKFGANNKWGYFPAISAGWRISDESFMKNLTWIDDLKIRGDFGVTGNQDFGSYQALSRMQGFGSYAYNGNYFTVWGPANNTNFDLKWEKGKNWNVGVDFSLFDNIVAGSVNYYHRRQQDLLGTYPVSVPPYLFENTFANVGTMRNTGIEIELNIDAVRTKDFQYRIGFIGSTIENKFLSFSNSEFITKDYEKKAWMESPGNPGELQLMKEGERVGNYYTHAYAGIDDNGNWLVWNKDNTERIPIAEANDDDKRVTGNGLPKFTMSWNNTFNYKNWDLSLYFRGAFGYDLYNVHDLYFGIQNVPGNVLKKAYDENAAITTGANVLTDYFMENGDYLKLDAATLGYRFNLKSKWIEGIRLYATGTNLFTITSFSGVDPTTIETNGLTPGVNTHDGNGTRRYYPTSTQLLFGIQLDF